MNWRVLTSASVAVLVIAALAGCAAGATGATGKLTRATAQSDTTGWIRDAASAVASTPPASQTKTSGFENCRNDHGFFVTTSEWRTVAELAIPSAQQASARDAISAAFAKNGWKAKTKGDILTLAGPKKAAGLLRVESGGASSLAISAISPCYHS